MLAGKLEEVPLCRFHYWLLAVIGLPYIFVAMDLLLISLALPAVTEVFEVPARVAGFLAGSVFIGMMIGAASWGFLADLLGRKRALELTILVYTVFTGLAAVSWSWQSLVAFRVATGLGLGGCIPLCFVYLSEFIPASHRGRFLVLLDAFWAIGWILAALLGYLIIPKLGWRYYFIAGAAPILALLPVHLYLPRSVRFLEEKGLADEALRELQGVYRRAGLTPRGAEPPAKGAERKPAERPARVPVRELWSREYRRRTVFAWALWFCMVYGYYSLFLWIVKFMAGMGYPVPKAMYYALVTSLAQLPGYFTAAYLVDVAGRKPTLTAFLLATAASTAGFSTAKTPLELVAWLSAVSFFCLGAWGIVMTYTAEVYPTRVRGTGYGAASGFGRTAGLIGPTLVGLIVEAYGIKAATLATAVVFLIAALDVAALGIETKGLTLEQISR